MPRLTSTQGERLLAAIEDLYVLAPVESFPTLLLATVHRLIGCELASFNEIDLSTGSFRALVVPDETDSEFNAAFARHMHEHPVIANFRSTGDTASRTISDFLSPRDFHRLALYGELFGPLGIEDQLASSLTTPDGLLLGTALNRSCGFSEEERQLLDELRPHLVISYQNSARFSSALESAGIDEELASSARSALEALTGRQFDVLRLVSAGRTNMQIAMELCISVGTVKKHVEHVLRRLDVDTRLSAARLFIAGAHPLSSEPWWNVQGASQRAIGEA